MNLVPSAAQEYAGAVYACALLTLMELVWGRGAKDGNNRITNACIFTLNILTYSIVLAPITIAIAGALTPKDGVLRIFWQPKDMTGALLLAFVYIFIWDFFQYWTHRAQHAVPFLWIFHRVHHSDPDVNASTEMRRNLAEVFTGFFLTALPTFILFGFNPVRIGPLVVLFGGWRYFNHANINLPLGPLTRVVSGPQFHRLHHGIESRYHDRNYAVFFPVLDIMFGTYLAPKTDEWIVTGIDEPLETSVLRQTFYAFRRRESSEQNRIETAP